MNKLIEFAESRSRYGVGTTAYFCQVCHQIHGTSMAKVTELDRYSYTHERGEYFRTTILMCNECQNKRS